MGRLERVRKIMGAFMATLSATAPIAETSQIVGLVIGAFVAAVLLPVAINQIVNTSTQGWNPAVATVFSVLLPILVIVAVVLRFLPKRK